MSMTDGGLPSPLDRPLAVTFFYTAGAWEKDEYIVTLRDLAPHIKKANKSKKQLLPWLKLAQFGEVRKPNDKNPPDKWSFRHNENVLAITGIEADYDDGVTSIFDALAILRASNLAGVVYSSPSHTEDAPRWRVLCPLSEDYPPSDRTRFLERLNGIFAGSLSGESFTLSQSYYFGSVMGNPSHCVETVEGDYLDLRSDLDAGAIGKPKTEYRSIDAPQHDRRADKSRYVEAVIKNALSKLSRAPDGQKHYVLREQSKLIGGFLHVGSFTIDGMAATMVDALPNSVVDRKAALSTAKSGLELGATLPLDIPDLPPRPTHTEEPNGHTTITPEEWEAIERDKADQDREPLDWQWGKVGATGPAAQWPIPLDIFSNVLETAPQVNSDHIPARLWPFVNDTSIRMGVDPTSVALTAIVTCASVIHDDWQVQPKRYDKTWLESARLWGCIVGDPSTLKSPIIMACTRIIDRLEAEARRRHDQDMEIYERNHAAWKKIKENEEPEPRRPKLDRYLVEGATMEAFQEVLRDDAKATQKAKAGKVLCRQDEMSEWAGNLDRYGGGKGGGDRGAYLRLYNGGRYTIDRIQRGSFAVNNWSSCFMTGCQPEPIQKIARDASEDGLLQRFIYSVPLPAGEGLDQQEDQEAIESYQTLIRSLSAMNPLTKESGYGHEQVVFHDHAHVHREEIDKAAKAIAAIPNTSNRVKSTLGKWPGLFARLCLTFHMIEWAGRDGFRYVISEETAERVKHYMLEIILPHLIRADAIMFLTPQSGHARWIAGHILAHSLDRITTRDIVQSYRALRSPEQSRELTTTMGSLVSIGWLDPIAPKNSLNPVNAWRVNPDVHLRFADQAAQESEARETIRRAIGSNRDRYAPLGFGRGD